MLERRFGQKAGDLRNRILGNKHQIPRPKMSIFLQAVSLQHLLQIEQPRFHQIVIHPPEQHHLRVLRLLRQPARNLHCLGHGRIRAQFVLAGLAYFASHNEIRPLEFLQRHRRLRIVQISRYAFCTASLNSCRFSPCTSTMPASFNMT